MRDEGLVTAQGIGNVVAYELNREHVAYPALTALLSTYSPYQELRRRLADLVAENLGPDDDVSVAIFGSVARMEATTDSDLDILVVVTDDEGGWSEVLMALAGALHQHVGRWTGNDVQLAQMTWDGLRRAAQERDPFAISLARDADTVVGKSVRDFIAVAVGA
jgi:predicted nucleotidyltransferase